jgi:hypothetical protein
MIYFPKQEDVRLQRAPLAEVICQVRFPPVLRIVNEAPVDFQEQIRGSFPQFDVEKGMIVQMTRLGIEPPSAKATPPTFRFQSPDGHAMVSLSPTFYALSTTSYINNLTFENTGATSVTELWEILRPQLTVLLKVNCWDEPLEMLSQLLLAGEENERLTLRSGFRGREEPAFLLDLDYYTEGNISLESVPDLCQRYHDAIYNAFRWCIREEKLAVFAPIPADEED